MQRLVKPVAIHADGERFDGFYAVQSGMLTVWHEHLGSRTARLDSHGMEQQVAAMLTEIFRECRNRRIPYSMRPR